MQSIDNENRKRSFDKEQYCGSVAGCYRLKEIFQRKILAEYCDMEFEGKSFKCLEHYDEYLMSLYGDYMKLPPKEKQVSHHTFTAYV